MSKFKIYKASAGSGKTYSLVLEYILILIKNPNEYKHILAVTFTNDATEEMKHRVLQQLHTLWEHPEKSNYIRDLISLTGQDSFHIQMRAGEALQNILHDYSNFNICTIDAFFQKILRAFAKDIGLSAGYNLHLETETAIHDITEKVIANTTPDHKQGKWLMKAALEKIEEGKSWNFRNELRDLFKETFREKFQEKEKQIQESYKSEQDIEQLLAITRSEMKFFEDHLHQLAEDCNSILKKNNLTRISFSNKDRSFYGWILSLQRGDYKEPLSTFIAALNNVEKWYSKSTDPEIKESIIRAYHQGLNDKLNEVYEFYKAHIANYNSNLLIRQNLTQFVIFESMMEELSLYKSEHDILFITDTNQFIHELMKDNDESFIFEKAGNYYHHYLIDEFQDTSALQWENFRPLISNAVSQGYTSLVVGDVKQSIYRFRNGDWRLLHEKAGGDITYHEVIQLTYNYRSCENIIRFNNTIYKLVPEIVANIYANENKMTSIWDNKFEECYNGQEQEIPDNKSGSGGYVKLKSFSREEKEEDEESEQLHKQNLTELVNDIHDSLQRGFKPSDIAILVFTRAQAQRVSSELRRYVELNRLQSRLNIVTQSSLSIANAHSVRLIVAAMSYLINKKDVIQLATIYTEYHQHFQPGKKMSLTTLANDDIMVAFIQKAPLLKSMPVILLVNEIINLFHLGDDQNEYIFIQYFKDALLDYLKKLPDDLATFMDWWEDSNEKYQVAIPENENSLRILTIHKSKGLQFNLVFIPFADWSLDSAGYKTDILWLESKKSQSPGSSQTKTLPLRYDKRMLQSDYSGEYLENKFYNYLDKLNLLYVATTRAVSELYIYTNRGIKFDKNDPKPNIKYVLNALLHHPVTLPPPLYMDLNTAITDNNTTLIIGSKTIPQQEIADSSITFLPTSGNGKNILDSISIKQHALDLRDDPEVIHHEKRESGILFHQVLSQANSREHALLLAEKLWLQKSITHEQLTIFHKNLEKLYGTPLMQKLNRGYQSYSEYSICIHGRIIKPDKFFINENEVIVIDFKTGKSMPEFIEQVKEYCDAVNTLFKKPATGFLYYTLTNEFVQAV